MYMQARFIANTLNPLLTRRRSFELRLTIMEKPAAGSKRKRILLTLEKKLEIHKVLVKVCLNRYSVKKSKV